MIKPGDVLILSEIVPYDSVFNFYDATKSELGLRMRARVNEPLRHELMVWTERPYRRTPDPYAPLDWPSCDDFGIVLELRYVVPEPRKPLTRQDFEDYYRSRGMDL